ncbi:MAG: triose-phosphate isomerase [Candidatus Aenigmatarchaeota archaeon]
MIVLNFKAYKEACCEKAIKLAKIAKEVSKKYKVKIFVAPQFVDIPQVSKIGIPVLSQHVDIEEGKFTGSISFYSLKKYKVLGSLINHSEKKVSIEKIKEVIEIGKKYNMKIFALASDLKEAEEIAKLNPYSLSYEPPELIGSGKAVSKVKPDVVKNFVDLVNKINPKIVKLCGAGITNEDDVKAALELGTDGILISSAFVFSKNPRKFLEKIARMF